MGGADFTGEALVPAGPAGHDNCNGHGSHCAGTAVGTTYGVAKSAKLWYVRYITCTATTVHYIITRVYRSVRVLKGDGSGTYAGVIAGVNWAVTNAVAGPNGAKTTSVISMSLGGGGRSGVSRSADNKPLISPLILSL